MLDKVKIRKSQVLNTDGHVTVLTVSDLVKMTENYDAAWMAAKCIEDLPEPPNFSGHEFDPRGLVNSIAEIECFLPWLRQFLANCQNGNWHRYAVAEFKLPPEVLRSDAEMVGRSLIFSHDGLGDVIVDIRYKERLIEFEFVGLL